jgi:DNA-directed RNA polymerase subunit N (RpoN/RPB10)
MIIPVRCFTCGEVLADKWVPYITVVQNRKTDSHEKLDAKENNLELHYIDPKKPQADKSIEGRVLDDLGLHKYCCRRMVLTNVHAISYIS